MEELVIKLLTYLCFSPFNTNLPTLTLSYSEDMIYFIIFREFCLF